MVWSEGFMQRRKRLIEHMIFTAKHLSQASYCGGELVYLIMRSIISYFCQGCMTGLSKWHTDCRKGGIYSGNGENRLNFKCKSWMVSEKKSPQPFLSKECNPCSTCSLAREECVPQEIRPVGIHPTGTTDCLSSFGDKCYCLIKAVCTKWSFLHLLRSVVGFF